MDSPKHELQLRTQAQEGHFSPAQILDLQRCENERLRVLVDFLHKPIHAHGGAEPDTDIVVAYNLAVEAALLGIRRAALGGLAQTV